MTDLTYAMATRTAARQADRVPWQIWLFVMSMVVPSDLAFELGGLRLDPQRIVPVGMRRRDRVVDAARARPARR